MENHGKSIIYITNSMSIRLVNYVELYSSYLPTGMFINRIWSLNNLNSDGLFRVHMS